jgi:S-methylmethionine-dependent homocysteine/selenocysteine methylase
MDPMRYRDAPPPASGATCITDGGMETVLAFHRGIDLPCFASFPLLMSDEGRHELRAYFEPFATLAQERGVGLVLDTPTWRANADWGAQLGYDAAELAEVNRTGVALLESVRSEFETDDSPVVISGCVGPRSDAYRPAELMTAAEAEHYHGDQIGTLSKTAADVVTALTLAYADEAIGIVRAAGRAELPVVISFTVETDGRLPDGTSLRDAVEQVDAETDGAATYFMINCAHPTHFADALEEDGPWLERIRGVRANASRKSHAELDESETLDEGDPAELAEGYLAVRPRLPQMNVVGGCCGTDHRHIAAIADAWLAAA